MNLPHDTLRPVLTFTVSGQRCGLFIEDVEEVAAMIDLTKPPNMPAGTLGLANRHGTIFPLLDVRQIFTGEMAAVSPATLFIVARAGEELVGLVVDDVQQVEYTRPEQFHQTPASGKYIRGMIQHKEQLIQIIALEPLWAGFAARVEQQG